MKKLSIFLLLVCSIYAKEPIRVYVDVVGDLFHAGHVQFFEKAKAYGDYLIVGIHEDEVVTDYKRRPYLTMEERRISIEACRCVDEVILDAPLGISKEWIKKHNIHIVVHGDDYVDNPNISQYAVPIEMGIFRTVPYTKGISTSDIIRRIEGRMLEKKASKVVASK